MSKDKIFVEGCLMQAVAEPARALVRLWLALRQQGTVESGFDPAGCESDARKVVRALESGGPRPVVHPFAALRAVDEYLTRRELGQERRTLEVGPADELKDSWFVVPRPEGWVSRLATQHGQIEFWLQRHQVVPASHQGITIGILRPPHRLWRLLAAPELPFLVGGFLDGVVPDWENPPPYRCRCLRDPETRWRSVRRLLVRAERRGVRIVVLPELTIDAEVRRRIEKYLAEPRSGPRFVLVVAGSFHEEGTGPDRVPPGRRNVAHVFDGFGEEILCHVKLRPMRATPGGIAVIEEVEGGQHVDLLNAPFGLVGLAVCLDYCEIGYAPVADLWRELGPALMLVPSMGQKSTN